MLITAVGSMLRLHIHVYGQNQEEKSGHEAKERVGVFHISLPRIQEEILIHKYLSIRLKLWQIKNKLGASNNIWTYQRRSNEQFGSSCVIYEVHRPFYTFCNVEIEWWKLWWRRTKHKPEMLVLKSWRKGKVCGIEYKFQDNNKIHIWSVNVKCEFVSTGLA